MNGTRDNLCETGRGELKGSFQARNMRLRDMLQLADSANHISASAHKYHQSYHRTRSKSDLIAYDKSTCVQSKALFRATEK